MLSLGQQLIGEMMLNADWTVHMASMSELLSFRCELFGIPNYGEVCLGLLVFGVRTPFRNSASTTLYTHIYI